MSEDAYVYVLYGAEGRLNYVGIGNRQRPYERHNEGYEAALAKSKDVHITPLPFSTREDAELAESLIIKLVSDAVRDGADFENLAGRLRTSHLVPLVPKQDGVLRHSDLKNSILVKVSPKKMDYREVVSGVTSDRAAAERCRQWWPIGSTVQRGDAVQRLVAVTTAEVSPQRVLGIWDTLPLSEWDVADGSIGLVNPDEGNVGGHRGKEFLREGYNSQLVGFSEDIRTGWTG